MHPAETPQRHGSLGFVPWLFSCLLLLLPTLILGFLAFHTGSKRLAMGMGIQLLFLIFFVRAHPVWRPPVSISVVVLYIMALIWAWIPLRGSTDWIPHVAQGILLLVAITLLAFHDLLRTGVEPLRRAHKWSRRIRIRTRWPAELAECRTVHEAVALRDALNGDPGPALALLSDPRPEVQTAALGALEHHPRWRPGEAEMVMRHAFEHPEPAVRAAAVYALAGVDTADLVASLADFLRDPAKEVRQAASEALMWDAGARWPFAREAVKLAMADPKRANEGPLFIGVGRLPAAAVADFITWSTEHPPLARRAILTVIEHFHSELLAAERPELPTELAAMMLDLETPPALRVEIASLLRDEHMLTPDMLDRLTNPNQPAPMRLFAAELMLRLNPHDPDGVDVLRGLARQPNRELALQVASVLQNVLGLDLGMSLGELPAPNSKQAGEVTRRVLAWANGGGLEALRGTPSARGGLPGSRSKVPGLGSRPGMAGLPSGTPGIPTGRPLPVGPLDDSLLAPPEEGMDDSLLNALGHGKGSKLPSKLKPTDPTRVHSIEGSLLTPPERSPLEDSQMIPVGGSMDELMGVPPMAEDMPEETGEIPPTPLPQDDDLLAPPKPQTPLEEDDLLAPPRPRNPLDDSLVMPDESPSPKPRPKPPSDTSPKPTRRPNNPF